MSALRFVLAILLILQGRDAIDAAGTIANPDWVNLAHFLINAALATGLMHTVLKNLKEAK